MAAVAELMLLPPPRRVVSRAGALRCPPEPQVAESRDAGLSPQGYRLAISPDGIEMRARDDAGLFYGRMTLRQIRRQCGEMLPSCEIEDAPSFASRGVMLDISRDKVPTMETLFGLVEELAEWKINHLELYTEHTFAYRNHRDVWEHASPMTADEVQRLDAFCRERFIELVPNQNSFGHLHRWLALPRYRHLAARADDPFCLDPTNPACLDLLDELYAELLPNFTSHKFNVGCDETAGIEPRTYREFLLKIRELVQRHGRTMHFWGDIVLQHPELVGELPRDMVVLEWGYEAEHPFDEHCGLLARTGLPFYVCPGTSSWNSIAGRSDNCLANLRNAAQAGRRHGAIGFLNTDWGDNGHWQYLPVSYLGLAGGAALAWNAEADVGAQLLRALDLHVFRDGAGEMAKLAIDLGNAYRCVPLVPNASTLFRLLARPASVTASDAQLEAAGQCVRAAISPLANARMDRPDAALVQAEFANAALMLLHACSRTQNVDTMLAEHRRLWLARNRPGGLDDSISRLSKGLKGW